MGDLASARGRMRAALALLTPDEREIIREALYDQRVMVAREGTLRYYQSHTPAYASTHAASPDLDPQDAKVAEARYYLSHANGLDGVRKDLLVVADDEHADRRGYRRPL